MQEELEKINKRNRRVEADKAWELSKARRALIAIMTYLVITVFLLSIGAPNPFLNALVPTAGFVLSTLTLPFAKKLWLGRFYKP